MPLTAEMLEFPFDGERLALDFAGTVGDRANIAFERLRVPDDLARWVLAAGLGERAPTVRDADLRTARDLREAIYRAVRAAMTCKPPARRDIDIINAAATRAPLVPKLKGREPRIVWSSSSRFSSVLSSIARDAIELLGGAELGRVRECAAPNCSLLFVDQSHSQRRRWCSMERCGNRNKTQAYRRRRAAAPARSAGVDT
jgi:predicted RNA-binding Zn ribbon-like protein